MTAADLADLAAGINVKMQMFRILVFAEVRYHASGSVRRQNLSSNQFGDVHYLCKQAGVNGQKRIGVLFRNDDDVRFPERTCVVIGEDAISFVNFFDGGVSAENFVAVKIFGHRSGQTC